MNGIDSLAQSIMYVCALIADQPRAIDRYIDYFGEARPARRVARRHAGLPAGFRPAASNRWAQVGVGKA